MAKTLADLNEDQIKINDDPRYWDWFEQWWDQDYSWEGLKKHEIEGVSARDYYRNLGCDPYKLEVDGRMWFCMHAPCHDTQGKPFNNQNEICHEITRYYNNQGNSHRIFSQKLLGVNIRRDIEGRIPPNSTINLLNSYFESPSTSRFKQVEATNSYIEFDETTHSNNDIEINFKNCVGKIGVISGGLSCEIENSHFKGDSRLGTQSPTTISISGSTFENLSFAPKSNIKIKNRSDIQDVTVVGLPIDNRMVAGDRSSDHSVEIHGSKIVVLNLAGSFCTINLSGKRIHFIKMNNVVVYENFQVSGSVENIKCVNSTIECPCKFNDLIFKKEKNDFSKCKFYSDVDFTECIFNGPADFSDAIFYKTANFNMVKFFDGADFSISHSEELDHKVEGFGRIDFTGAQFHSNKDGDCANFANSVFRARAIFDDVLFDGVPNFSGAKVHADTSFHDLKPFTDLEEKPKPDLNPAIYRRYHNAFRILRQHMEGISDYTTAFKFGRLEQISKRLMPKGPKDDLIPWEKRISFLYGFFADYGQSAIRPLAFLGGAWLFVSLIYGLITHSIGDFWSVSSHAIGHAFVNSFPPISYAIAGFFKSDSLVTYDFTIALQSHPLTGTVMTLHALFSAIMVFFILLALKRRFQIR